MNLTLNEFIENIESMPLEDHEYFLEVIQKRISVPAPEVFHSQIRSECKKPKKMHYSLQVHKYIAKDSFSQFSKPKL